MKRLLTICAVAALVLTMSGLTQAELTLDSATYFGGTGDERGTGITITDGALYVSGITGTGWGNEGLVVQYALPPVSPEWFNTWPGVSGPDAFFGVAVSSEGAYLAGNSYSRTSDPVGGKEVKTILVKYPLEGTTPLWLGEPRSNFFRYSGDEKFHSAAISVEDDGTFIYATGFAQAGWWNTAFVIAKYDTSGNLINKATDPGFDFGSDSSAHGHSRGYGLAVLNGSIYVAGFSSFEDGVGRPVLTKYDPHLTRIWKQRPTELAGWFNGVTAYDGTIYAVGYTYTPGAPDSQDYLIQKYDEAGSLLWTNISGGADNDILTGVVGLGDRVFTVGYTESEGVGGADAVILEIDPETGETLSTTLFGGAEDDIANGVATDGADIYVVGQTASFGAGGEVVTTLCFYGTQPQFK